MNIIAPALSLNKAFAPQLPSELLQSECRPIPSGIRPNPQISVCRSIPSLSGLNNSLLGSDSDDTTILHCKKASNTYLRKPLPRKVLHTKYGRSKSEPRADSRPQTRIWNVAVSQSLLEYPRRREYDETKRETRKDTGCTDKSRGGREVAVVTPGLKIPRSLGPRRGWHNGSQIPTDSKQPADTE